MYLKNIHIYSKIRWTDEHNTTLVNDYIREDGISVIQFLNTFDPDMVQT